MAKYHFIGIGGIGMSALAACCCQRGDEVTGSDRAYFAGTQDRILQALETGGIKIFPQDGSFVSGGKLDAIVFSSAIEESNPDLAAAAGIRRMHRSELLRDVVANFPGKTVAVTGSCGKSSVTAYAAEALGNFGIDADCLNGALVNSFIAPGNAGNYHRGDGRFLVFESDESDKSLLNYHADYAVVLNMGCDHYCESEQVEVFARFLNQTTCAAVIEENVYRHVKPLLRSDLPVRIFGAGAGCDDTLTDYFIEEFRPAAKFNDLPQLFLPRGGRYTAMNALAVFSLLQTLGFPEHEAAASVQRFSGVWRRNDFAGVTVNGTRVFDDYAHNPEKIISCLAAAKEIAPGRIFALFQPHGYGPFGFMEAALFEQLQNFLAPQDRFYLFEPFYAGGTSAMKPSAREVIGKWQAKAAVPQCFICAGSREETAQQVISLAGADDVIVIMGARDNSLSDYARSMVK